MGLVFIYIFVRSVVKYGPGSTNIRFFGEKTHEIDPSPYFGDPIKKNAR